MSEKKHAHVLTDGQVIEHTHSAPHTHESAKIVSDRLARAIGHLQKVKNMVENGEDCSAVLIQLSAVRSAVTNAGKLILKDHLEHCIVEAIRCGNLETLRELGHAMDLLIK